MQGHKPRTVRRRRLTLFTLGIDDKLLDCCGQCPWFGSPHLYYFLFHLTKAPKSQESFDFFSFTKETFIRGIEAKNKRWTLGTSAT